MMGSRHRPMPSPSLTLLFLLLSLLSRRGAPDLAGDRAALVVFRSAVGKYLPWNLTAASPCRWPGVTCKSNRVTTLRLPASGLMGQIPSPAIGNLTALHTLSLRYNALAGPLPSDLAALTQLRNLYLQGNKFTGVIPPSIFALHSLIRLNLADNEFSGEIPAKFNDLTRLANLYLENNRLVGEIPEDLNLPSLTKFNVSFNNLNGSIPQKLRSMPEASFLNTSLCGGPQPPCPWEISPPSSNGSKLSGGAIAGIAIGSVIAFLIIVLIIIFMCKKKNGAANNTPRASHSADVAAAPPPRELEMPLTDNKSVGGSLNGRAIKRLTIFGDGPRVYDLEDLLRASAEVLGKGTFGTVYKAVLERGTVLAVKRLKEVNIPEREFRERIAAIGALEHSNLVALRAYYYSKEERLLVYDYMPMGSLSSLLHGENFSCSFGCIQFS